MVLALHPVIGARADESDFTALKTDNLFGVATHLLRTGDFFNGLDDSWSMPRLRPVLEALGTQTMALALYAYDTSPHRALVSPNGALNAGIRDRRILIDHWLGILDRMGKPVLITLFAHSPRKPGYAALNLQFADWLAELVRDHPAIAYIQLHNEPNLPRFWNRATPGEYVTTYRAIAEPIKAARPDIKIVGGAISSLSWAPGRQWLRKAISAGLLDLVDGVSVHPYNRHNPPEDDPHFGKKDGPVTDDIADAFADFWSEIDKAKPKGKPLSLFITETGYSSAISDPLGLGSESQQADYLSRAMLIYLDLRVSGVAPIEAVYWYDLKDDGTDNSRTEDKYGLVTADLSREKPAFSAYKSVIAAFPSADDLEPSPLGLTITTAGGAVAVKLWHRKSDDTHIIAFWRYDDTLANADAIDVTLSLAHSCDVHAKPGPLVMAGDPAAGALTATWQKGTPCRTDFHAKAGPRAQWAMFSLTKTEG